MSEQPQTPQWTMSRVLQVVGGKNFSLTQKGTDKPALEITAEGRATLNTSLTVGGPLTLGDTVSATSGPLKVGGGLSVSGLIEAKGGIAGDGAMPKGAILMWAGDVNDLPRGWALCDGRDGRPDLRGRFPVGADGGPFALAAPGGEARHRHSVFHDYRLVSSRSARGEEFPVVTPETGQRLVFDTQEASSLPPYLPLHFIVKL